MAKPIISGEVDSTLKGRGAETGTSAKRRSVTTTLEGIACSMKVLCELVSPGRAPRVRRKRVENKRVEKPQNEQLAV